MIEDLKSRGYEKVTLGVKHEEEKNKAIYNKYGFTEHIKDAQEYIQMEQQYMLNIMANL